MFLFFPQLKVSGARAENSGLLRAERVRGMTLIELVIAVALLSIVIAAIALFTSGALRRNASFTEAGNLDTNRGVLSDLLRADFNFAGLGLTRPKAPGVGVVSVPFSPSSDFDTSTPGTLRKTGSSGFGSSSIKGTVALARGVGACAATLPFTGGLFGLTGSDQNSCAVLVQDGYTAVYESNSLVFSDANNQTGDLYSIAVENNSGPGSPSSLLKYYRTRGGAKALLYPSSMPPPAYPLIPFADVYAQGAFISDMAVTGAPVIDIPPKPMQVAQLPMDGSSRMTSTVVIDASSQSVTLFGGDPNTDVFRLKQDYDAQLTLAVDGQTASGIAVEIPSRGSINASDYVLLIDFYGGHSALCRVTDYSSGVISLERITQNSPLWNRFWSAPADAAVTFPAGSILVKLAPAISWSFVDSTLLRREGSFPASVAAQGVDSFNVREAASASGEGSVFEVVAVLHSEGIESAMNASDAVSQPFSLTLTPRALNLTYNQNNQ